MAADLPVGANWQSRDSMRVFDQAMLHQSAAEAHKSFLNIVYKQRLIVRDLATMTLCGCGEPSRRNGPGITFPQPEPPMNIEFRCRSAKGTYPLINRLGR
ncbi:hypothetical protein [Ensifer adhaerens]|uniref:hypothetical protein n=1 Tax=Ensifer adhaerens TaxID=106592 RepID=UPI00117767DA|nr:hypothetical protein [Ensifer adhaerens]